METRQELLLKFMIELYILAWDGLCNNSGYLSREVLSFRLSYLIFHF